MRLEDDAADHQASCTGWPSGPTTRPCTVALGRSAIVTSWLALPGFGSSAWKAWAYDAAPARLTRKGHALADLPEHVVLAGAQDGEIARAGHDPELERAVRRGRRAAVRGARLLIPIRIGEIADPRPRDGLAGAFLGDLAADQHAPGQGQVHRMLDRPLGPFELLRGVQIGLPARERRP